MKNNAKIIFIGGAPRVGKTSLVKLLSNDLNYSWVSTDSLRESVVYGLTDLPKTNDIFSIIRRGGWDNLKSFYSQHSTQEIINLQNQESTVVSSLVKGFVESVYAFNPQNMIIEGVALLPRFFDKKFIKNHYISFFGLGNTDYETFSRYSWENRSDGDWLKEETKDTHDKVIKVSCEFSKLFERECRDHNYKFFNIDSTDFANSIRETNKSIQSLIY